MIADPSIAIGLGLILSLFFTETLGVTAGGVIVPGYIALFLNQPNMIIGTFIISIITYLIVKSLSYFILIYGKRRLVLSLIIGFLLGFYVKTMASSIDVQDNWLFKWLIDCFNIPFDQTAEQIHIHGGMFVIGNIIPGLIANWMDRQGVIRTTSVILITASIVHLILMLLYREVFIV